MRMAHKDSLKFTDKLRDSLNEVMYAYTAAEARYEAFISELPVCTTDNCLTTATFSMNENDFRCDTHASEGYPTRYISLPWAALARDVTRLNRG